jgi:hypothetical protein
MRALLCLLLAACGTYACSRAASAAPLRLDELSKETAADVKDLAAVDSFAVGGVGVAGVTSPGEKLTRAIATRPDAIAAFEMLATGDNPAARVYAYWALRELRLDPRRAARHAVRLGRDRATVLAYSGCMRYQATVAELVASVASRRGP